jgi:hypothetical protein
MPRADPGLGIEVSYRACHLEDALAGPWRQPGSLRRRLEKLSLGRIQMAVCSDTGTGQSGIGHSRAGQLNFTRGDDSPPDGQTAFWLWATVTVQQSPGSGDLDMQVDTVQ